MSIVMPMSPQSRRARPYADAPPVISQPRRRSERGFGLVEIIVVLIIIAILMAVAIGSFRGSKRTTHYKAAQSAALLYAGAIDAYMADNGQTPPRMNQAEWPAPKRGPIDAMLQGKTYMRSTPEAVQNGLVSLRSGQPQPGTAIQAMAQIGYTAMPNQGRYVLHVRARSRGSEPTLECVITNAPAGSNGYPNGIPRC